METGIIKIQKAAKYRIIARNEETNESRSFAVYNRSGDVVVLLSLIKQFLEEQPTESQVED